MVNFFPKDTFKYQILVYPVLEANFSTESYQQYGQDHWLTKENMIWFWDNYCPEKKLRTLPEVSPVKQSPEVLSQVCPTLIIVGEYDILRDEGEKYAHQLADLGVPVTSFRCLGAIHDFLMLNDISTSQAAQTCLDLITVQEPNRIRVKTPNLICLKLIQSLT